MLIWRMEEVRKQSKYLLLYDEVNVAQVHFGPHESNCWGMSYFGDPPVYACYCMLDVGVSVRISALLFGRRASNR